MAAKIIFDGAYGIRSFGDDAPLIVLSEMLRSRLGAVECVVVCRHAHEQPYEKHGIRSVEGLEYPTKAESIGRWFRGFNPDDDREGLCQLYDEIASSDLLVLGAGNFLIDITIDLLKGPVPRFLLMSLMARMTGTPVMWYGISVGPLKTRLGQDMSRLAASLASSITVRDEKSLVELKALGINAPAVRLPDPVLGLKLPPPGTAAAHPVWHAAHADGRPVIAVSVRTLGGGGAVSHDTYLSELAEALDRLIEIQGASVLLIPQCIYTQATPDQDDRHTARQLTSKMRHSARAFRVEDDLDVYQCASLYQDAAVAVCTRLHGCVFAVLNGIPTVALSYHAKVSEFMNWLGLPQHCLPLDQITASAVTSQVLELFASSTGFTEQAAAALESGRGLLDEYARIASETLFQKVRFPSLQP